MAAIDLSPTDGMKAEARRYKAWKKEGQAGGTEVAAARARQILSGSDLSEDTVIEMSAWFARHEVDKQGKGFRPDGDGYPSPGRVAWAAWGGDPGQTWSTAKSNAIKNARERSMEAIIDQVERAAPDALGVGDFVQWDSSGGMARGKITQISREGSIDVPDSSFTITASAEDPAALIRVYRENDGENEATDRLVGHKFSTLTKIAALRFVEGKLLVRSAHTEFASGEDERTLEFPFASETPVERMYGMEVLSMDEKSMDLKRLNDGAPLLYQHDPDRIIGVVQKAYIKNKRGYARVKLANNDLGREMQELVRDGIIRNVSFGYRINAMEEDQSTDPVTFRATNFQPFELSLVSIPADATVGIGRSFYHNEGASTASAVLPTTLGVTTVDQPLNLEVIRAEAAQAKAKEMADIIALGQRTKNSDMAQDFIANSRGLDEFRSALLEKMSVQEKPVSTTEADIGMTHQEAGQFSFQRAINYLANPTDRAARDAASFEIAASEAAAAKLGRQSRGITVPQDVMKRDLVVGTATAGGNLVATDLVSASFIDLLRNASALDAAGATVLTGLSGNVAIPKQSGAGTSYWVAESGAPTESQQSIDQISMTPKTVAAFTDYSRRLMIQSSIDVENMIRRDLATVLGLRIDLAGLYGLGSQGQPLGLKLTTGVGTVDFAAATPTFAEVVDLESDVATANALLGSPVYLMNAAMRGGLKTKAKDAGSGLFVMEGTEVNGYRGVLSNQVASGDLWFGNFADLLIGFFSGLDLLVDPYTNSTSGTVRVVAMQDVDIAVRNPESFSRGNDTL